MIDGVLITACSNSQHIQEYDESSLSSFDSVSSVENSSDNNITKYQKHGISAQSRLQCPNNIGANITIDKSSDVHIGNKNIYQGPVIIKQFLRPDSSRVLKCDNTKNACDNTNNACDNLGFIGDDCKNNSGVQKIGAQPENIKDEVKRSENIIYKNKGFLWLRNLAKRRPLAVSFSLVMIVVVLTIMLLILLVFKNYTENKDYLWEPEEQDITNSSVYESDLTVQTQAKSKLRIISRVDWLAQPPVDKVNSLSTPVPYVIIQHTATDYCNSHAKCVLQARTIQMFHIESRGWSDIGYNFLVGGDGAAYEGRGWTNEGAHTYGYNARSIGIGFIGTFTSKVPPTIQIIACKKLIEKGVGLGYISKDYKLLAARQLHTTESPGKALYEEMQTWDHWAKQP